MGHTKRRTTRIERLESRRLLTAAMETYAWHLINEMRADPPAFATSLETAVADNGLGGYGYAGDDPLWDDIRRTIDRSFNPQHYQESLALMRATESRGPFGWENSLAQVSQNHNDWMETHCFAHSQYGDSGSASCGGSLPGFSQPGINGDPNIVDASVLGPWSDGAWGENIGYGAGTPLFNSASQFGTDSDAYRQRLAFSSTLGFIIEVNSSSLGHLENLLRNDQAGSGQLNTIGIDFEVYAENFGTSNTTYLVTHTIANRRRTDASQLGHYVAGVAYSDANGNGAYDLGEGYSISEINGQAVSGYDHGMVSVFLPRGESQLTVSSGSLTLADSAVQIVDRNVVFVQESLGGSPSPDTIGLFEPAASRFHLKETFEAGASDHFFQFGGADSGWTPVVGDWDGDGVDTIGLYQPDASLFHLRNELSGGGSDVYFAFGPGGAGWIPLAGDWDGDGVDTIGLYQPDLSLFHLKNSFTPGGSDIYFQFGGGNSGWTPIAGDWDGDGVDTIGLYQGDASLFHLKNDFTPGIADVYFAFGPTGDAGWIPLAGDFDGDGSDSVGLFQPDASLFHLNNSFSPGAADIYFAFGPAGSGWIPLIGDWNGSDSQASHQSSGLLAPNAVNTDPGAASVDELLLASDAVFGLW